MTCRHQNISETNSHAIDTFYADRITQYEFAVVKAQATVEQCSRYFYSIVLRNKATGIIVWFTDYADYAMYLMNERIDIHSGHISYLYAVTQMLNFILISGYAKYRITSIGDITKPMLKDFMLAYASTKLPSGHFPSKQSVQEKRNGICVFLENELADKPHIFRYLHRGQFIKLFAAPKADGYGAAYFCKYKLAAKVFGDDNGELQQLMRDMPLQLKDRFIRMAEIYDPELVFAIVLQLYGGLREGEICNVSREQGIYSPGIIVRMVGDNLTGARKCVSFEIDLRHEYQLRSDHKRLGEIKKERFVGIYGPFTETVYKAYRQHLDLTSKKTTEEFAPMFLNKNPNKKNGVYMAMTISGYRERIRKLFFNHVLPSCQHDLDPDLAMFYAIMQQHTFGAHAFRHWFTVFLIYSGVDDIETLMTLRGDSSPLSAQTYLKRKGVLMREYKESLSAWGNEIRLDGGEV